MDLIWLEPADYAAWRRRVQAEHAARNLTRARRDALAALLTFVGPDGLFPSDATVAERAGVCARTVRRARADARELGLLTWEHTRKLVAGRWRQGPNRYAIQIPERPVCPGGQGVRGTKKENKKKGIEGKKGVAALELPTLEEARTALLARQAAIIEAQRARYAVRFGLA